MIKRYGQDTHFLKLSIQRNVVLVQGPRRPPEMSYVCSFGSTGIILSVGDSIETCGEQMNWLKRKHKGIGQESMEGDQRMANYALLCETNSEIRVFELYHFLAFHFPHWELVSSSARFLFNGSIRLTILMLVPICAFKGD
eukprot:Protomagalhaensia_sp_Gyna_25__3965@NODE_356_length_3753_cov_20_164243_g275_i0_p4_GENE_NODE_356_length_3753_cov_20_164243_g275_i0NODE_356_length_3753_cov_20_164243_g275_i0_p4_ORF_typecomplete_len140_score5_66_NODE_356_length_3753_cov_20_164243_g275_i012011620